MQSDPQIVQTRIDEARQALRAAAEAARDGGGAGEVLLAGRDLRNACQHAMLLLSADRLSTLEEALGETAAALEGLVGAQEAVPEEELCSDLAQTWSNLGVVRNFARRAVSGADTKPDSHWLRCAEAVAAHRQAKDWYMQAWARYGQSGREPDETFLINLAIELARTGRIAESLTWYAMAARLHPDSWSVPPNRVASLYLLFLMDADKTQWHLSRIREGFSEGVRRAPRDLPQKTDWLDTIRLFDRWKHAYPRTRPGLQPRGEVFSLESAFVREHDLALSITALYDGDGFSGSDDLSVRLPGVRSDRDADLSRMELCFSSLKSRYLLARRLTYAALSDDEALDRFIGGHPAAADLSLGEESGYPPEMLRSAFRLACSTLDGISRAVHRLLKAESSETAGFSDLRELLRERAADPQSADDMPSSSLYSQAMDMCGAGDAEGGAAPEWAWFRERRRSLDEGTLVLTREEPTADIPEWLAGCDGTTLMTMETFQRGDGPSAGFHAVRADELRPSCALRMRIEDGSALAGQRPFRRTP